MVPADFGRLGSCGFIIPYIKAKDREKFAGFIEELAVNINGMGEMNYVISKLFQRYMQLTGLNYHAINQLVGVLECIKLELYSQVARPYEDKKIAENGPL